VPRLLPFLTLRIGRSDLGRMLLTAHPVSAWTCAPVAARDTATTFELPFVITGPWDSPLVLPDTQALFNRAGAPGSLIDAVRNRLKRGGPPAEPPPIPADARPTASPH